MQSKHIEYRKQFKSEFIMNTNISSFFGGSTKNMTTKHVM